jgi:dephospho-CoA kinase
MTGAPMVIAITGDVGAGKSEAARCLWRLAAHGTED